MHMHRKQLQINAYYLTSSTQQLRGKQQIKFEYHTVLAAMFGTASALK